MASEITSRSAHRGEGKGIVGPHSMPGCMEARLATDRVVSRFVSVHMESRLASDRRAPYFMLGRIGRARSGFTLLEVVAAVFIFLMGVVGVISLFASATVFHKDAGDKTLCALLIEEVVHELDGRLKNGSLRDPAGKLKSVKDGTVRGYNRYGYEAEFVEQDLSGQSMIRAKIRIVWKDRGKIRGESFDHVFRPGPAFRNSVDSFLGEEGK